MHALIISNKPKSLITGGARVLAGRGEQLFEQFHHFAVLEFGRDRNYFCFQRQVDKSKRAQDGGTCTALFPFERARNISDQQAVWLVEDVKGKKLIKLPLRRGNGLQRDFPVRRLCFRLFVRALA